MKFLNFTFLLLFITTMAFAQSGNKVVLIEEFTGSWCGWCPDGEVVVDHILATYPDKVISVSIHSGDDMEFSDGIRSGFGVNSYPSGMVDRKRALGQTKEPIGRSLWMNNAISQLNTSTPVDLTITTSFNATTRVLDISFTADFVDAANGDIRFVPMIVEDSVTGTGSGYNQSNYTNNSIGHPYYQAGDPMIGYVHKRVLRALPGGAFGNAGIIPATVTAGATYTENFQYTIPVGFNENQITVVGGLAYYSTTIGQRQYMNATKAQSLNTNTSVIPQSVAEVNVFPNPTASQFTIDFNVTEEMNAEIILFDIYGRQIEVIENNTFVEGKHNVSHNIDHLASGNYFVSIITDKGQTFSRRLTVMK